MQKITPFLWFDDKAEEAVNFYTSIFKNSRTGRIVRYGEGGPRPKGTVMTATFELGGHEFMALNGGPVFKFSPAISFFVNCTTTMEIDEIWQRLSAGGSVLMELAQYPFSEKFGWVADKYGVSWQLNLAGSGQHIAPFFMFVGKQHGKAQEAINFYVSRFSSVGGSDSRILAIDRYGKGEAGDEGTVKLARFFLNGQEYMAIDGGVAHDFTFTPAISFFVRCETQEEVDELWEKLSEAGEQQQCGWLKDKYGVSWQIVPAALGEMLQDKDPEKSKRVMTALLQMTKLDIKKLKQAYEQQ